MKWTALIDRRRHRDPRRASAAAGGPVPPCRHRGRSPPGSRGRRSAAPAAVRSLSPAASPPSVRIVVRLLSGGSSSADVSSAAIDQAVGAEKPGPRPPSAVRSPWSGRCCGVRRTYAARRADPLNHILEGFQSAARGGHRLSAPTGVSWILLLRVARRRADAAVESALLFRLQPLELTPNSRRRPLLDVAADALNDDELFGFEPLDDDRLGRRPRRFRRPAAEKPARGVRLLVRNQVLIALPCNGRVEMRFLGFRAVVGVVRLARL